MAKLRYCVRNDATGSGVRDATEERADWDAAMLLAHVQSRVAAGHTVVDLDVRAHPPHDPPPANPLATKRARMQELRAKTWAGCTLAEREEARALAFELGEPSPPAA